VKYLRDEKAIRQFGERLKEIRLSKKISQQTLALKVGLEQSQVGRIERALINTSISHAILLAKGLGVAPHELFIFPVTKIDGKKTK